MTTTSELVLKMINVRERLRPLSEELVADLMSSMKEVGLLEPIVIWRPNQSFPVLAAGLHRLEAARRLGWETIRCVELNCDTPTAGMVEIAENLHRKDLTREQRDQHIRRYVELLKEREATRLALPDPVSETAFPKLSKRGRAEGRKPGIATKAAADLGLTKQRVNQALAAGRPKPERQADDSVQERTAMAHESEDEPARTPEPHQARCEAPLDVARRILFDAEQNAPEPWSTRARQVLDELDRLGGTHLTAAAPDLLDALKAIVQTAPLLSGPVKSNSPMMKAANAAIAKAEGRS